MKIHLRTFGCRANHYDSETVRALALNAGHEIVDDATDADVAVFNSCAVTSEAERDVRKAVRRAAARNPRLRSVVMGCAAALPESQPKLRALPSVELVSPGAELDAIAEILCHPEPGAREAGVEGSAVAQLQHPLARVPARFARDDNDFLYLTLLTGTIQHFKVC